MGSIRQTSHIDVPPEQVFALAIDAKRVAEWNASVIETKDVTGSLDQVGASYTAVLKIGGRHLESRWQVSRVEQPGLLEITGTAPGGGRVTALNRFESADSGTDSSLELDYDLPGGFVGGIADKLFVERAIERDAKHSAENFKAICEADGHVPA